MVAEEEYNKKILEEEKEWKTIEKKQRTLKKYNYRNIS